MNPMASQGQDPNLPYDYLQGSREGAHPSNYSQDDKNSDRLFDDLNFLGGGPPQMPKKIF